MPVLEVRKARSLEEREEEEVPMVWQLSVTLYSLLVEIVGKLPLSVLLIFLVTSVVRN